DLQASGANNSSGTATHPNVTTNVFSATLFGPVPETIILPTLLANGASTGVVDNPTAFVLAVPFTMQMVNVINMANLSNRHSGDHVGVVQGSMALDVTRGTHFLPEPGSVIVWSLAGLGLVATRAIRRRRRA